MNILKGYVDGIFWDFYGWIFEIIDVMIIKIILDDENMYFIYMYIFYIYLFYK